VGYDGIAWNVTVPAKAIVPCAIKCVDIESIAKEIAKDRFVKLPQYSLFRLQREAKVFQQKTRITVIVDDMKDIECLSSKKSALASYDLIAVLPKNDKMFQYVCLHAEVDIISYKLDEDLTFRFKMSTVGSASSRRVVHEICYAPLIRGMPYFVISFLKSICFVRSVVSKTICGKCIGIGESIEREKFNHKFWN
jgi:RNase P/RNase MRP subunit p30